jgi:hypothetical protein
VDVVWPDCRAAFDAEFVEGEVCGRGRFVMMVLNAVEGIEGSCDVMDSVARRSIKGPI